MNRSAKVDRQTVRIFLGVSARHKKLLAKASLYPLGTILWGVVAPLYIGKTLGALALPHGQPMHYLTVFVIAAAVGLLCNRIGHPAVMKHQAVTLRDIQELTLATLLKRSVGFHNNNIGGKLVSDAIDYPAAYARMHDSIVSTLTPLTVTLVIGSAVIYIESWMLGAFITTMTVVIMGLGIWDSRRRTPRRLKRMLAGKDVTAHLADTVTNIQTTKTFSREAYELKEHRRLTGILTNIRVADWHDMSTSGNTRLIILATMQALLVFVVIGLVRRNPALLGMGIFAFSFTVTLTNRLFEINLLIRNVEESLLEAAPMTNIIEQAPEIQDKPGAKALAVRGGDIACNDITFAYADAAGDEVLFSSLNLTVKAGEKVGLVGPSGGGKSTLTRLLLRFEDVTAGSITIDDQDISAVTQASLRQSISYVPQEPLLFHRTIHENIAYGHPMAPSSAVKKAAQLAHADEFISRLQRKYQTVVGERGVKLSGGQRQRIAIARAILKDAPILVLDEATSALDSESEVLIQDALWKLMDGRTAIVIAHRLSTIQKMDRIVVLDGGKIVEQGTHAELLKQRGLYAKLWAHQSGGFIQSNP